ncbi:hypothetical protein F2Q68_00042653 [Brassica cretica]|uniref:Uncharacterized protein n=1 Tax=Brassica cretica TaxID=69181 RepID=A0A8S9MR09_BRACR|nr:hypothetical protein F2Q68_00042653 [Brassica cretica]
MNSTCHLVDLESNSSIGTHEVKLNPIINYPGDLVLKSERKLRVGVDENVERVDEFGSEDERVLDEIQEPAKGEELVIKTVEADEFLAAVSREDVVAKEMVVREEDGP